MNTPGRKTATPGLHEVALGAMLHDIGKFMQRAHGGLRDLPEAVRARESVLLPTWDGRYTHWHALWSDAFFDWAEQHAPRARIGLDWDRVRDAAVYHHNPAEPWHWLCTEADRLASGMDRKAKDEAQEAGEGIGGRDAFRRTPLLSVFAGVRLAGRGGERAAYGVEALTPEAMIPAAAGKTDELPAAYARLWPQFCADFAALSETAASADLLHEGLIALSERFLWAIPSSTVDQPDVSLHDHSRAVAAIAACLYRFHEAAGELGDAERIKDRERPKFRILAGDLSGIQAGLFRLANQQVKGVNRILRARSFLMGALVDTAALLCRRAFGVPPYCALQTAGGRFQILVPALPDAEAVLDGLRKRIDDWMLNRYAGELALNLSMTPPFAGADFLRCRFPAVQRAVSLAVEAAKQRPLGGATGVLRAFVYEAGADGACPACGARPAVVADPRDPDIRRCRACHDEHELGSRLPRAGGTLWLRRSDARGADVPLFEEAALHLLRPDETPPAAERILSGWRIRGEAAGSGPVIADRFLANHVPILGVEDGADGRYEGLSEEAQDVAPGEAKTFEHLARDARERVDGRWVGREALAVLKADVDRLGQIFGCGLGEDRTVGRVAALSRMMDAFFTGRLTHLIRTRFPNAYMVYSGGDDLLIIAPWRDAIGLAAALRADFRRFVGGNPDVTLSAGIELVHLREPLNRAVRRAEDRLEKAKEAGRDRVFLIADRPISWPALDRAVEEAEWLNGLLRAGRIGTGFLYKMLSFDRDRRAVEEAGHNGIDPRAAGWRARWAYHRARQFERMDRAEREPIVARLDRLLCGGDILAGPTPPAGRLELPPAIPITIALYRNR